MRDARRTATTFADLAVIQRSNRLPDTGHSFGAFYAYTALGEVFAWGLAWLLILEYGLAGSALAAGSRDF